MKIECIKEKLRGGVMSAEKMTGKNLSLPVLGAVLIEAGDEGLLVKATNLDLGVELAIPAKVEKKGSVAVSGAILGNFLSAIGEEHSIRLESVNDNLAITSDHHSTLLKSLPTADFPTIPRLSDGESFEIPAARLVGGLRAVCYSASISDMKPEIASVYVYGEGSSLVFVATDSFRLAEKKVDLGSGGGITSHMLIPVRNALEIVRIFDGSEADVTVRFNKNQVSLETPGVYLTSRLVSGNFPNYRQIVPSTKKTSAVVAKRDFSGALKLAQIFSDKFSQVQFKVVPGEKLLEIGSKNSDTGENTTTVDATLDGEDLGINFNVKYILDCFQSIPEDSLSLDFNGSGRPMIVRGLGNASFLYLVMPMNR